VSIFVAAGPNQSVTFDKEFSPIVCGSRPAAIWGSAWLLAKPSIWLEESDGVQLISLTQPSSTTPV
jgi:hypothetical protein